MIYQRSSALFAEAQQYIPGGVNSPVRAFKSVGGTPLFIEKAQGAYLIDADGNSYIDYINSWGPMIIGHAHPKVVEAVKNQLDKGFSYGTPTELETEIAQFITSKVPHIDKIRMVNSGTEACMSAVRLARGVTGKSKIIKFSGCYHGHADAFLIAAGSGASTFGTPSSPGVTQGTAADTLLANFNDIASVSACFDNHKDDIAAVIIEPVAGNMGCIPPQENFLQELRQLCDTHQSLLIFDEVMTGFRLAFGGAQEVFNVQADLVCFGKIIGGGMPVGAFAGKNEIMNQLAPEGKIYQAGTLSGNPIAMRAGITTLQCIAEDNNLYPQLENQTQKLASGIQEILTEKGIEHCVQQCGSMMSVFFGKEKVAHFQDAQQANHTLFNAFFHHALSQGVYLPPSGYETWFISKAITDTEIEKTLKMVKSFQA